MLRLEPFSTFLPARVARLKDLFKPYGDIEELDDAHSTALWDELRALSFLVPERGDGGVAPPIWRISAAPAAGAKVVRALTSYMPCTAAYDWSGGLIWLEVPASSDAGATDVRRVMATHGGHATLIRAEPGVRAGIDVFQPQQPGVERIGRQLKAAFDPMGILNPGRMYVTA